MRTPVIIVNFKAYVESIGPAGLKLARICEEVVEETGVSIAVAPAQPDLSRVAAEVRIPVLAQHFDPVQAGSRTGWVPLEAVEESGAVGSLLNHSERKMTLADLRKTVELCRTAGIDSVVCADTIAEVKKVAKMHPDFIAIEPPELIGGDISVTTAKPGIITDAIEDVGGIDSDIKILCGAGVKNRGDVEMALLLGTVGVLLASGVVKSPDPRKTLLDLARGLKETSVPRRYK